MKCDELKQVENPIEWGLYYDKAEVDEAIAELKRKIEEKDKDIAYWREEYDKETQLTDALKAEIESLKASHYAESVDEGMRERRLRRALWLARAERAKTEHKSKWNFSTIYKDYIAKWKNVERKCLAKAEEYK